MTGARPLASTPLSDFRASDLAISVAVSLAVLAGAPASP